MKRFDVKTFLAAGLAFLLIFTCACGNGTGGTGGGEDFKDTGDAKTITRAVYNVTSERPLQESSYDGPAGKKWREEAEARRELISRAPGLDESRSFFEESAVTLLAGSEGRNLIYSPLNVYMAMAMLSELTAGEYRDQLLDVLHVPDLDTLRLQAGDVFDASYVDDGVSRTLLSDSIWLSDELDYSEELMQRLADNYYASSFRGAMGSEDYNDMLHEWLNNQTEGLLKDQAEALRMDNMTVALIVSTIYYKVAWQAEFSEKSNTVEPFHAAGGDRDCTFMNITGSGSIWSGEGYEAASLPTDGGGSMWFVMPEEGGSIDSLINDEEAMGLAFSNGGTADNEAGLVHISVPKFDVSSSMDLIDGFERLGFEARDARLVLGTSVDKDTEITRIEHDARLMIDEKGVTGAAFTAAALSGTSMPPENDIYFKADRPFVFVVMNDVGIPVFTGVVNTI